MLTTNIPPSAMEKATVLLSVARTPSVVDEMTDVELWILAEALLDRPRQAEFPLDYAEPSEEELREIELAGL